MSKGMIYLKKVFDKDLAEKLKGGVIMDVVNVEQAKIAEKAGAVAVMALERVQRGVGIGAAHGLVQSGDEVVAQ